MTALLNIFLRSKYFNKINSFISKKIFKIFKIFFVETELKDLPAQNYKIIDDLRQKSIKAKKENDLIMASRLQSKKEIAENMKTSEKMLKSAQEKYSDTISKLNIIEQNKVVSEKENKMNSINLSKIETEIVEKHSFFEELSEKVQSLKNIYALELSTTKKMLKELKNDYGSISTSSKKIKENEILITSFIESLITEKNKSVELVRNQYKEND